MVAKPRQTLISLETMVEERSILSENTKLEFTSCECSAICIWTTIAVRLLCGFLIPSEYGCVQRIRGAPTELKPSPPNADCITAEVKLQIALGLFPASEFAMHIPYLHISNGGGGGGGVGVWAASGRPEDRLESVSLEASAAETRLVRLGCDQCQTKCIR